MAIKLNKKIKLILTGIIAGLINGFFGAGGGLLIVPMLSTILRGNSKLVHATTLACVLCTSVGASIMYFVQGEYDMSLIIPCIVGGSIGGVIGTFFIKKLKNNIIDFMFSIVLILAGISMIIF